MISDQSIQNDMFQLFRIVFFVKRNEIRILYKAINYYKYCVIILICNKLLQLWYFNDEIHRYFVLYFYRWFCILNLIVFSVHRQFEKTLSGSFESLRAFVADMFIFDSKAARGKSKLRFCLWTVSDWKSTVLLLCLCSELTSYHSFHYEHFCIKCFCCFEF